MSLPTFMLTKPRRPDRFAGFDPDAKTYLQAVEAADGAQLEPQVLTAINTFIVGLKDDGLWSAIGAACVLAGARTLAGCLTPLRGVAPTQNSFLASDYDRRAGLAGNGLSKYINTGYSHTAAAQNNKHVSALVTVRGSTSSNECFVGIGSFNYTGSTNIGNRNDANADSRFAVSVDNFAYRNGRPAGFYGATRNESTGFGFRVGGVDGTSGLNSQTHRSGNYFAFATNINNGPSQFSPCRLYWYSAGTDLSLPILEARLATLKTALDSFFPAPANNQLLNNTGGGGGGFDIGGFQTGGPLLSNWTLPVTLFQSQGLALVFSASIASLISSLQSSFGTPGASPAPVGPLTDGRYLLSGDVLSAQSINEGGANYSWWSQLEPTRYSEIAVMTLAEASALIPQE